MGFARFALRRLVLALVVIAGAVVVTFFIARVLPADPAQTYAGENARAEQVELVRDRLGLDQPLTTQFVSYVQDLARLELGTSLRTKQPIAEDIGRHLPPTLELAVVAITMAVIVGVPFGVIAAARKGTHTDRTVRYFAISGAAIPSFWIALMSQLVFVGALAILPLSGLNSPEVEFNHPVEVITGFHLVDAGITGNWVALGDGLRHIILPATVLAILPASLVMRMTRASMTETLQELYIVAARAAGLPERMVLYRLALKNAAIPTLTVIGLVAASTFTGAVLVEVIFAWPGLGRYVTEAVFFSDFPVVVAVTLVGAVVYSVVNLIIDLIHAALDPRIRLS
jgi:peptide/nickel transport system permease protein